jgi:hypothetical protein
MKVTLDTSRGVKKDGGGSGLKQLEISDIHSKLLHWTQKLKSAMYTKWL